MPFLDCLNAILLLVFLSFVFLLASCPLHFLNRRCIPPMPGSSQCPIDSGVVEYLHVIKRRGSRVAREKLNALLFTISNNAHG